MHSSVVEKLSVVDKTLPPDNFYLTKAPSSGQLSVVDKKSGISMRFCCSLLFHFFLWQFVVHCHADIYYHFNHSFILWCWVKLRSEVIQFCHLIKALLNTIQLWQEIHPERQPESAWKASHWWKPFKCHHCDKTFVHIH